MIEPWDSCFRLTPGNPPNDGIMFANLEPSGRSGHLGHALAEYEPGKIIAFYPNCSAEDTKYNGHSGYGWMEFRRSVDGGDTWSEPFIEPNSKALFDSRRGRTQMCEKAVRTDNGTVVLFYLTCDMATKGHIWEPYFEPYYAVVKNGGESFSAEKPFVNEAGRVYDALYRDGKIYVLFYCNAELPGIAHLRDFPYKLYVSENNGETFEYRSTLSFQSTVNCYYGTMEFTPEGRLIVYIYDEKDKYNLKYIVSDDGGYTWSVGRRAFFEKKMRNPQLIYFGGRYWMHGRSGSMGENAGNFVLYSSPDGFHWDGGCYLRMANQGHGAYSNSIVVHRPGKPDRLLIQTSHAYFQNRTNTIMWFLDCVK